MSGAAAALALVMAMLAQGAIAPLFPLSVAVMDIPLVTLALIAFFAGTERAMIGLPVMVVAAVFAAGHDAITVAIAYLPLVPLAAYVEQSNLPLSRGVRFCAVGLAIGIWVRLVFSATALLNGGSFAMGGLILDILLPGFVLDLALLALAYGAMRLIGWEPRKMTLQLGGF